MTEAGPPPGLCRQRRGTAPQMRGRYPDHDVLDEADHWDEATRRVVLARLCSPPPLRVFDADEGATLEAFCDTVMAQDCDPRVPVLGMIDEKLHEGRLEGYRYAEMPADADAWKLVARGLDEAALEHGCASFAAAPDDARRQVCQSFSAGELRGGVWDELPVGRAWTVVMRDVVAAFYSHPWAWNEIGFGGPAYPRGHARLGVGLRDGWEADEEFSVDPVVDVPARGLE